MRGYTLNCQEKLTGPRVSPVWTYAGKRDNPRTMSIESLLSHLDSLLAAQGLSDRRACLKAREINPAVGVDFLRDMRRRKHLPRTDKLAALAQVLGVPVGPLVAEISRSEEQKTVEQPAPSPNLPVSQVQVCGEVQAGVWKEAHEWPLPDQYAITIPYDAAYPGLKRYGLMVKGQSMNRVFQDGSVVIVINFSELGRRPRNGDYVVAMQRSRVSDGFEATIKAVQVKESGQMVLWPQSTEPEFQSPIILPAPGDTVCHSAAESPDVTILALVVGSYVPMPTASFQGS
ncbi:helix-turn-helix transcriptional regulator [Parasaccharibacter sp. TMW 2.1891]|uniref:Phage repressor n=4 Tax=Acetobacteraceae TaxID=433 RepID=A0ABX4ZP40_9PROT|nr:helix-turn-helix transcriptional regulator [Parasaccharibacter sp. TMW 2.1891]MPV99280.1 helix-turn-helix transcriptional regulator [Bombella apis]POS61439.1 phage repressor [Parasaccharibacter apium]POS64839.1 phage repressor [Parasaccharibacter apium]POS65334.1 phage repressor [Parasaccharibacter apium]